MAYSIEITRAAAKGLRSLPVKEKNRLLGAIQALASEPRPMGAVALKGSEGLYRMRLGNYRIIYRTKEDTNTVLIVMAGHRKDVYRKL